MNPIRLALLFALTWLFSACHANTGHSLSTDDPLETPAGQDWRVTWTISAPKADSHIFDRLGDPVWHYSIDEGPWRSVPFQVARMADSQLQLTAVVTKDELHGTHEIQCYPTYTFDGNKEGRSGLTAPRVVRVTNKGEQAVPPNGP